MRDMSEEPNRNGASPAQQQERPGKAPGRAKGTCRRRRPARDAPAAAGGRGEPSSNGEGNPRTIVALPFEEVETERLSWLWKPYIAFGEITLLEGPKGMGKSTIARAIAAGAAGGPALPGHRRSKTVKTLWLSLEENRGKIIKRALKAARLPEGMAITLEEKGHPGEPWHPILPGDEAELEEQIRANGIGLLVLDPLSDFVKPKTDMRDEQEMRPIMRRLHNVARKTDCAVLPIRHFGKDENQRRVNKGLGSVAIAAVARSVLHVDEHEQEGGLRVLTHVASNLDVEGPSRVYRLKMTKDGPRVEWLKDQPGESDQSLEQLAKRAARSKLALARQFIRETVTAAGIPAVELLRERHGLEISDRTMDMAREREGVRTTKETREGKQQWVCYPPEDGFAPA
jgi:KaiC/GvpD/RAD55 family RecA-like ATPase